MDYTLKNIDNELWKRTKAMAALKGISIKQLILSLLAKELKTNEKENR